MKILDRFFGRKSQTDNGEEDGLNSEKEKMIRGVVTLSETTVKEVMVPRIDVAFLGVEMVGRDVFEKVVGCGHSRFPVYKDNIDNVVGVLYAKDLLRFLITNDEVKVDAIIRKPYFVPESKRLDSLLREMRRRRVHIAVAVDEYGGVSGIVCLEDIIEEIVGDIQDEFDNEQEELFELGDGTFLADARLNIEELNAKLGVEIPEDDFDTLGGFVFDLFGKVPSKYEKVGYGRLEFIIQEMDGHKIKTVKLSVNENGRSE
ncbi:MAG: hemolysin family protein [Spirochaetales bacterium]